MINFTVENAKDFFFDRLAVADEIDRKSQNAMSKYGAFVRRTAKGLIRPMGKKGKSAKPGKPPKSFTGLLKENIFFVYDAATKSVVVGPTLLNGSKRGSTMTVPQLLEKGGRTVHWRTRKTATYNAFPFMVPAAEKNADKFGGFFAE